MMAYPTPEERVADPGEREAAQRWAERLCLRRGLHWLVDDARAVGLAALWDAARRFDPDGGQPWEGWLRRIVTSAVIDLFRREGKHGFKGKVRKGEPWPEPAESTDWLEGGAAHPMAEDDGPARLESREEAAALLARLEGFRDIPAKTRDVILLTVLDDWDTARTAERLGLSKGVVYAYRCNGLRRLRETLAPIGGAR